MMKIGLIGEDPNDTDSIKNLLLQKHKEVFHFIQLLRNKRGYQLDNPRTQAALKIEYERKVPDHVLFIRDVDGLPSQQDKIKKVNTWFNKLNKIVSNKGILLMNIYELEAIILADIQTFNKLYNLEINFQGNVMYQIEPKEYLIRKTYTSQKTYSESHCPKIFEKLNFDVVIKNCEYFSHFYENFKQKIKEN